MASGQGTIWHQLYQTTAVDVCVSHIDPQRYRNCPAIRVSWHEHRSMCVRKRFGISRRSLDAPPSHSVQPALCCQAHTQNKPYASAARPLDTQWRRSAAALCSASATCPGSPSRAAPAGSTRPCPACAPAHSGCSSNTNRTTAPNPGRSTPVSHGAGTRACGSKPPCDPASPALAA